MLSFFSYGGTDTVVKKFSAKKLKLVKNYRT